MEVRLQPGSEKVIQKAVNQCKEAGGGIVVLEAGVYVTGTICLKDNVTLKLEKGALLLGSDNIEDYPDNETCFVDAVGHKRGKALIYAYHASNIALVGSGTIEGRGGEFPKEHPEHLSRPFLVRLVECQGILVKDIALRQSAAWCLHIQDSEKVRVEGVDIMNRCNGNNDGIDIDGCSGVTVENCRIDSGDDALCLKSTSEHPCRNVTIRDCQVTTNWAAFKIGTESVGDFENIEISHCCFYDVKGCGIKIVPVDGGNVTNLWIHHIHMINCTGPVFISTGERLRRYFQAAREVPGIIKDVRIENITARTVRAAGGIYEGKPWGNAKGCVVLSGCKDRPLENIVMRNCYFSMPGGEEQSDGREVPRMGARYPEFHLFDPLPSWGMYLRHMKDSLIENLTMENREADVRPMIVKEDTANVLLR